MRRGRENFGYESRTYAEKEMGMDIKYRIGLKIGITSVGWALLENNMENEPMRIVDLGVRTFEAAEIPKTGETLAYARREARTVRRKLRRRKHRLDRIKWLLQQEGIIEVNHFMEHYQSGELPDVYQLRYEALNRIVKGVELAQILIHIAGHRGFCSHRKMELTEKSNGVVLSATEENKRRMEEKGYRTVGEMLYLDEAFRTPCCWNEKGYVLTPRNGQGDYRHTILRSLIEEEVRYIFHRQRELGNTTATEVLEEYYLKIMLSQRSFDMGPGRQADGSPSPYAMEGFEDKVGLCALEERSQKIRRGARAAYTSELFAVLLKINSVCLIDKGGNCHKLTEKERQILMELAHTKREVSYAAIRKKLNISEQYRFYGQNYSRKKMTEAQQMKQTEKVILMEMPFYFEYQDRIGGQLKKLSKEEQVNLMDEIGTILTLFKNDDSRCIRLQELGVDGKTAESLLELNPSKFQQISLKAMHKIIPFLERGLSYMEACEAAGYRMNRKEESKRRRLLKAQDITEAVEEISNPVAKRSIFQTIKVINAIIQRYGSPQAVHMELARELSKTYVGRKKQERQMAGRQTENERVRKEIQESGTQVPKGSDIIKYRLWQDQQGICLYSGEAISLESLLGDGYEIDHVLPFSSSFDDSYRNKVLVKARENQWKKNNTPYEYFGTDPKRWKAFEQRVNLIVTDCHKQQNLLRENFTQEDRVQMKQSNLSDTKYLASAVLRMIEENLAFMEMNHPHNQKPVLAVNGAMTAYLRKRWGLTPKDCSTDIYDAKEAVVAACCTDGMIQRIFESIQGRELHNTSDGAVSEGEQTVWINFPKPWPGFLEELELRTGKNLKKCLDIHPAACEKINDSDYEYHRIRPVFVSKMPRHKLSGAVHADTIRSPRHYKQDGHERKGCMLSRTALTELKLNKNGEITNYYNKSSDLLLYNALKEQLTQFHGDAKKAFKEPFYKPKADGTPGNIVKKVKLYDNLSLSVPVNDGKGIAANAKSSMVRIDIFYEDLKYYFVPVYLSDVVKKILPNRAATFGKPWEEWRIMKAEKFLFSLYSRDLILFKHKNGKEVVCTDGKTKIVNEEPVYFTSANIRTASLTVKAHDSSFTISSLGIQSLVCLEKYQVDVLGNITKVKSEKRQGFK